MNIEIEVNGQRIKARKGDMILSALKDNGIHVPTLCHMEGFRPSGACRLCVVEVEGRPDLIPACSFPVEEWMKISTHSARVIQARRTILELLLSCHPGGCLYCEKNRICELQSLASELNVTGHQNSGVATLRKKDLTSQAVIRDPAKCVICGRCVRTCQEVLQVAALDFLRRGSRTEVGTVLDKGINYTSCVDCGQCILVCPTGAIQERIHIEPVIKLLQDKSKYPVAIVDPAVVVSICELFGHKSNHEFNSLLATAFRRIGFKKVYSASWGNEYEMGLAVSTFMEKRERFGTGPALISTCPAFVRYIRQSRPDLLPNLLQVRPGRQIMAHVARVMLAEQTHRRPEEISVVHFTSCTAIKSEIQSPEKLKKPGFYPDHVLTTRELYRLIRLFGIHLDDLRPESQADLFGTAVRSGYLPALAGGFIEGCLRILAASRPELALPPEKIGKLKGLKEIKECACEFSGQPYTLASVSGLATFEKWLAEVKLKKRKIDVVEVMACPNGCINGGGQPLSGSDRNLRIRMKGVLDMDDLYSGVEVRQLPAMPVDYSLNPQDLIPEFTQRLIIR